MTHTSQMDVCLQSFEEAHIMSIGIRLRSAAKFKVFKRPWSGNYGREARMLESMNGSNSQAIDRTPDPCQKHDTCGIFMSEIRLSSSLSCLSLQWYSSIKPLVPDSWVRQDVPGTNFAVNSWISKIPSTAPFRSLSHVLWLSGCLPEFWICESMKPAAEVAREPTASK
jgi:hypothetical protein